MSTPRINLQLPLNPTGCGIHGQHLVRELIKLETEEKLKLHIDVLHGQVLHSVGEETQNTISNKLMLSNPLIEDADLAIFLGTAGGGGYKKLPGKKSVAYIVFETDELTSEQHLFLSQFSEVWTPNHYHAEILKDYVPGVVRVVHEGVANYSPLLRTARTRTHDLHVLNIGKFEKRKGHEILVEALIQFADDVGSVQLDAYWDNPWNKDGHRLFLAKRGFKCDNSYDSWEYPDGPPLKISLRRGTTHQSSLWSMINSRPVDVAVYPHFGEAWGLPILESAVAGIPILAPFHTGSAEYMNSFPVDNQLWQFNPKTANDGVFFHGQQGLWYETEADEISTKLESNQWRWWSRNRTMFMETTLKEFSWLRSAEKFLGAAQDATA